MLLQFSRTVIRYTRYRGLKIVESSIESSFELVDDLSAGTRELREEYGMQMR